MSINKKILIYLNLGVFALMFSCKSNQAKTNTNKSYKKPNIVLLFVDDYGWSDIGYRNTTFKTPNLDQFKKESLDFTRAYIPTPTCSPSRVSLLTGKESARIGFSRHIPGEELFINESFIPAIQYIENCVSDDGGLIIMTDKPGCTDGGVYPCSSARCRPDPRSHWPWRGPSQPIPRFCCWMNRFPRLI